MNILPEIRSLQSFAESLKGVSRANGKFCIPKAGKFTYSQLIDKFESLMQLPDVNEGLALRVFTRLVNLEGEDERIAAITEWLSAWADEAIGKIPRERYKVLSVILPSLFKEDPITAARFIHDNDDAKAVALKLPGDEAGNSVFALAEGVSDWEAATGLKFDKRFSLYSHESDYYMIERVHDWEEVTGLPFDKRFTFEQHQMSYTAIFEKRLAAWGESTAVQAIRQAYRDGMAGREIVLDLRGLEAIPDVVGAIPNLKRLYIDEGVVLPRFPRKVELDLIQDNPSLIQNMQSEINNEQFLFDALKRNIAVLQFLPLEVRYDMGFLLRAAEQVRDIIAHIPAPLKSDDEFMLSLVKVWAFGQEAWEKYFGDVGDVPPLPENIGNILCVPDPFNPGKKVAETHMLFLLPATVNGKPLNLDSFEELVKAPQTGNSAIYDLYMEAIRTKHGLKSPEKARWVLMTMDVIPGSRKQSYIDQQGAVEAHEGYVVPDLLSSTVGILTYYVMRGERLFPADPMTLARCHESAYRERTVVGGFGRSGFKLLNSTGEGDYDTVGMAAMRKF